MKLTVPGRFYYVRGARFPRIDSLRQPSTRVLQRPLHQIKRTGIAWLYRGVYVGVVRRGTYTNWIDPNRPHEVQNWGWTVWALGSSQESQRLGKPSSVDEMLFLTDLVQAAPAMLAKHLENVYSDKALDVSQLALDGIPLAIHAIDDDSARAAALDAFLESIL